MGTVIRSRHEPHTALAPAEDFNLPSLPDQDSSETLPYWYMIMVHELEGYPTTMVRAVHARTKQELAQCTYTEGERKREQVIGRLVQKMNEAGWRHMDNLVFTTHSRIEDLGKRKSRSRKDKELLNQALRPFKKK